MLCQRNFDNLHFLDDNRESLLGTRPQMDDLETKKESSSRN